MYYRPKFFTLQEFLTSSTARQRSIENLPSFEAVEHLSELISFLDGLRTAWQSGIRINSGYRNPSLNKAVGGVANSAHLTGYAADLYPTNGKFDDFVKFVTEYVKGKKFDQLLIEKNKRGQRWLHFGLKDNYGRQRCEIKDIYVR